MGVLYLVGTPIGNLEDITLRGLRILREVRLIAAEDTRHTRRLLAHYEIATPSISYHQHNKLTRLDTILAALKEGDVALVSDAGMPALSDPGFELVRAALAAGVVVSPIPGPSAPIAALVVSGLPTDRFLYLGFLPRRSVERQTVLGSLAQINATLICFEAPHRLLAALADAQAVLGNRQVVVARELTKLHEEFVRLPISEARQHFEHQRPRGECTLLFAGADSLPPAADEPDPHEQEQRLYRRLRELRAAGERGSVAARTVAKELGLPRSDAYKVWLTLDNDTPPAPENDA